VGSMLAGLTVIYAGGWAWLAVISGPRAAFSMAVAPFIAADAVKIAIGAMLLPYVRRIDAR
jgi:biotin transport system substrate-specific component